MRTLLSSLIALAAWGLFPSAACCDLITLDWYGTGLNQPVLGLPGVTVDVTIDTPQSPSNILGTHEVQDWFLVDRTLAVGADTYQWSGDDELTFQRGGDVTYTATFSQPIPANQVVLVLEDLSGADGFGEVLVSGGTADTADFFEAPFTLGQSPYNSNPKASYNPANGIITGDPGGNSNRIFLIGSGTDTLDSVSLSVQTASGDFTRLGIASVSDTQSANVPEPSSIFFLIAVALGGVVLRWKRAGLSAVGIQT